MNLDLPGRVRNTNLPLYRPMMPLFEAVVNSIHSIEDLPNPSEGRIIVHIERDHTQKRTGKEAPSAPVFGFVVEDNGVGFNKKNFDSFNTADSTLKAKRGGKGVGRFVWLKAFQTVSIESHFADGGKIFKRAFDFVLPDGVSPNNPAPSSVGHSGTKLRLGGLFPEYAEKCPKETNTIATRLLEHCLTYFLLDPHPQIIVQDEDETVDLQALFDENVKAEADLRAFEVKGKSFTLKNLRLYGTTESLHRLHYCANGREVNSDNLGRIVPDLNRKLRDENGTYVCVSYLEGEYLDRAVNAERTDFSFPRDSEAMDYNEVSRAELRDSTVAQIKTLLHDSLAPIAKDKEIAIRQYIVEKAPRYRALLKHTQEYLSRIPVGLDERQLDAKLYEAFHTEELDLMKKGESLLRTDITKVQDRELYKKEFNAFVEKTNDFGKANLADYIAHRKVILELLSNNLRQGDVGYAKEEAVHEIVFPLKAVSEDVPYESQNLWIIDERLSFHSYLASDVPLQEILEGRNQTRPDILIFDEPFAFAPEQIPPASVVIVEFKRPDRRDYSDKNPIDQIYDYVRDIRENKKKDRNGRIIQVSGDSPFYGYLICDLTPSMIKIAENKGFTPSPDRLGFFGYNPTLKTYVEVISYTKLVEDARKRNQILFDRLLLPRPQVLS